MVRLAKVFVVLTASWHILFLSWLVTHFGGLILGVGIPIVLHGALLASPFVAGRGRAVRLIVGLLMLLGARNLVRYSVRDLSYLLGGLYPPDVFHVTNIVTNIAGVLAYVVAYVWFILRIPSWGIEGVDRQTTEDETSSLNL